MGKVTINIPDELEKRLRGYIAERFSGEKLHGKLSEIVANAIEEWLDKRTDYKSKR